MLGCSAVCPNCKHQFQCCAPAPPPPLPPSCCAQRRPVQILSGGGLVTTVASSSPQVSPSLPLTFVLPPLDDKPERELDRLSDTVRALRQSGWFYETLSLERSNEILKNAKVGTFLVRNSSNPRYLFSLSVQTECGPLSVRLFYINGYFRLDAQPHLQASMPFFPGVVDLVEYYVRRKKPQRNEVTSWVDLQGQCLSSIRLEQPLRKDAAPSPLKHQARLAINRELSAGDNLKIKILKLELPRSLTTYLLEYPYSL